MEKQDRYSTSGLVEDQYMPGSNGKVLKNLLGIAMQEEIERVETELLFEVSDQLLDEFNREKRFIAVRHGLDRNYVPIEKVFTDIISRSVKAQPA